MDFLSCHGSRLCPLCFAFRGPQATKHKTQNPDRTLTGCFHLKVSPVGPAYSVLSFCLAMLPMPPLSLAPPAASRTHLRLRLVAFNREGYYLVSRSGLVCHSRFLSIARVQEHRSGNTVEVISLVVCYPLPLFGSLFSFKSCSKWHRSSCAA
jgi:hypothetical protein